MFCNQSPATAELFEERSPQLFEVSSEQSSVETYIQQPFKPSTGISSQESSLSPSTPLNRSLCGVPTEPSTPGDSTLDYRNDPPGYVGSPGPQINFVSDPKTLAQIAAVSQRSTRYVQADNRGRIRERYSGYGK